MNLALSRHAAIRSQQRGIPPHAIDYLLAFGREHHDHHGAVILLLDRASIRHLSRSAGLRGSDVDNLRGLYAVVAGNGRVTTVGHRTRRLQRH
jgi:hypothetical protein